MTDKKGITFTISEKEASLIDAWFDRHICSDQRDRGKLVYEFSQTGVGTVIIVHCKQCGAAIDISDYDSW